MARHEQLSAAEIARGSKTLAEALRNKTDTELTCRGMRHAWEQAGMILQQPRARGDLPQIKVSWTCSRGCGVTRYDLMTVRPIGRSRDYKIVDRSVGHYSYPPDYQVPGVPRGVPSAIVLWQEYVRRAMEDVANAAPGERERSA